MHCDIIVQRNMFICIYVSRLLNVPYIFALSPKDEPVMFETYSRSKNLKN
jgi:hypothetical protein